MAPMDPGNFSHGKHDTGGPRNVPSTQHKASGHGGGWGDQHARDLHNLDTISADRLVEIAEDVGKRLSPKGIGLKINQIRRFLDEARQIEAEIKRGKFPADRVVLLRPKLAYAAGREQKVRDLMTVLDPAIRSASRSEENFKKFLRLIEGIVAYHRFHGGTN